MLETPIHSRPYGHDSSPGQLGFEQQTDWGVGDLIDTCTKTYLEHCFSREESILHPAITVKLDFEAGEELHI